MLDTNDVKSLLKRLKELDLQAESLETQRNMLNIEARKWVNKREFLNLKIKEILNELKLHRNRCNETIRSIKKLKNNQSEIITQINSKRQEGNALKRRINKLLNRTSKSANSLKRQINKLNWKIQTTPLPLTKENEIINQIRILENQLLIHGEVANLNEKLTETMAEIRALKIKNNKINSQITKFANTSQEYDKKKLDKMYKVKPLKDQVDNAHKKYLQYQEAVKENNRKNLETIDQIKIVTRKLQEIENAEYNTRLEKRVNMISETAYKKLKAKKKLTLDEFKLLKNKGLI